MKCEFCCESFENKETLKRHLHKKHGDEVKLAILEHPLKPETKKKKKQRAED